jgi:hypothetical protein
MATIMNDLGLLREYVHQHSEEAFRSLVRQHTNLVFGTAMRRTGNATAAEEISQLNENMVALLGMTEGEKSPVEQTYSTLRQQVHALEAAAIQRVDPPQSNDTSGAVFARIPALTSEVGPLVKQAHESLKQILGAERADLLAQQAEIYFNQNHDGLGTVTREFLQNGGGPSVRYTDSRGSTSFRSQTFPYIPNRTDEWEYLHLFGPNGPIKLK